MSEAHSGSRRLCHHLTDLPVFLAGTIFAVMISSISFGQESKSVMVLYSLPITPDQILRAKAFVALVFTLTATVVDPGGLLGHRRAVRSPVLAENLVIAIAIRVEEVFIGLGFGAAHPGLPGEAQAAVRRPLLADNHDAPGGFRVPRS